MHSSALTDRSRKVMELAQNEAAKLGHNYIGTEHILLGIAAEGRGVAAEAIKNLGVNLDAVQREVHRLLGATVSS